ncbi:hypothetical protein F2P81_005567 [Scophthalmus maximus]|uniref:3CxxC-type domain-containing protein n=1 Tax=Scophthalmus maximus TaxID=52904 RepID=A0A6A4TA09_SCOMX|nr:hypothetical protein F2P81_005567 [Scophthalmus maximus]
MVVFHMRLMGGTGTVKVKRFRQNCKRCCSEAPMVDPSITAEHITVLMRNLVKKIRIKCYNENLDQGHYDHERIEVNSPHEPAHCEGCMAGICTRAYCKLLDIMASKDTPLKALTPIFNLSAIRPVMNMSTCTNVSTFFILYGILGVDEKSQLLMTYLWLSYLCALTPVSLFQWWRNEFVHWDPIECGTHKIALPKDKFWIPDIVINEFMDENTAPDVPYLYLHSDGRVQDAYPAKVVSSCNLNIYTFPFDIQNCTLTFNSYLHVARDIKIFLARTVDHITEHSKMVMTTMGEWELLDITSHHHSLDNPDYIDELAFHIRVRRRATLYVVNLLVPSCFLITVDLFSFLLPPQTTDRSSFKMTLILGYTVFLLIMNDLLPITGDTIPLISIYFSVCLALMVISLLETVIITNVLHHSSKKYQEVPHWVRVVVLKHIANLICYRWPEDVGPPCVQQEDKPEGPNGSSGPWVTQPANQAPAQHPADRGDHVAVTPTVAVPLPGLTELQQIREYLGDLRDHLTSLQRESQLQDQWCHVGYVLDYLLFRIYLLLISCYALVIISMWCVWISQS